MLINSEKYACEACVRGHRVSSCSHSERKLLHVNKKGRPVSQCPHCRSLRKNRSQHVKCECHDKSHAKEDCPHLKDLQDDATGPTPHVCCCGHGARCTCSLKKEPHLDTVPEDVGQILPGQKEAVKPRTLHTNNHDSRPTIFTNGHHKPVHKFNDAHNHCGAPYRVPSRSNSHHGHREIAQRSTDSLPLANRPPVHHESPLHTVINASQPTRQARSEHNSPLLGPTSNPSLLPFQIEIPTIGPNDFGYSPFGAQSPTINSGPHLPETIPDHWFTTHDDAHNVGPPSVPELAYIDWTKYGFGGTPTLDNQNTANMNMNMNSLYGLNPNTGLGNSQVPSYAASMEHLNQLTSSGFNTSSGDLSEVDDLPNTFRPTNLRSISHASADLSSTGATDDESYRLSSASSYFGTPAGNMLASNFEDLDIDKFISEQKQKQQSMQSQTFAALSHSQPQQPMPELQQQQVLYAEPQPAFNDIPLGQQQPTPPQSHDTASTPESIRGFSITSHPSSGGTTPNDYQVPYSIEEAQIYAHMMDNRRNQMVESKPEMPQMVRQGTLDDPMLSQPNVDLYGDESEFTLDDPKEDEAWAR